MKKWIPYSLPFIAVLAVAIIVRQMGGDPPAPAPPLFEEHVSILLGRPLNEPDLARVALIVESICHSVEQGLFQDGKIVRIEAPGSSVSAFELQIPTGSRTSRTHRRRLLSKPIADFSLKWAELQNALKSDTAPSEPADYGALNLPGFINETLSRRRFPGACKVVAIGNPLHREYEETPNGKRRLYPFSMNRDLLPNPSHFLVSYAISRYGFCEDNPSLKEVDLHLAYTFGDRASNDHILLKGLRDFWDSWRSKNALRGFYFAPLDEMTLDTIAQRDAPAYGRSNQFDDQRVKHQTDLGFINIRTGQIIIPPPEGTPEFEAKHTAKFEAGDRLIFNWLGTDEFDVALIKGSGLKDLISANHPKADFGFLKWESRFSPRSDQNTIVVTFTEAVSIRDLAVKLFFLTGSGIFDRQIEVLLERKGTRFPQGTYRFEHDTDCGMSDRLNYTDRLSQGRVVQLNIRNP